MSSIEDLRTTLVEHADHVARHDEALPSRAAAVAGRVRGVRRRRRAALAGTAAAVLAVAGATTLLPAQRNDPEVAAQVVGVDIPQHLTSLGRTYTYDHKVEAKSGTATIELPASDTPRLVSWATKGSEQEVRVSVPDSELADGFVSHRPDFADFTVVPEDVDWTVQLEGPGGALGIAVYDLAKDAPGVTRDGVTFREHVADRDLLAAEVGARGEAELSLTFRAGNGTHYIADWCTSGWDGRGKVRAWASLLVNGKPDSGMSCGAASGLPDPGASASFGDGDLGLPIAGVQPGDEVTLTLRLTPDEKGRTLLDDPAARLGLGVYLGPEGRTTKPGDAATTVEHDGHLWRLVQVNDGAIAPGRPLLATMPAADERLLVGFRVSNTRETPIVQLVTDGRAGSMVQYENSGGLGGSALAGYATPGTGSARLTARGGSADASVDIYELVE